MSCRRVQGGPLIPRIKFRAGWSMFGEVKGHFLFQAPYFLCAGDVLQMCSGRPLVPRINFGADWSMYGQMTGHFLFQAPYFLCAGDVLQTCSGRALGTTYQVSGRLVNVW